MVKPICKDCGTSLFGHLINGARRRRCTSCHEKFKASYGKTICKNCGVEILSCNKCETCRNHYPNPRVLDRVNIREML